MVFGEAGGAGSSNNSPTPRPICAERETGSSSSSASSSAYYLPYYPRASSFQDENQHIHSGTSLHLNPAMTTPLDSSSPFCSSFNDSIYAAAASASATHVANAGYYQSSILSRARPVTPPPPLSLPSTEATMVDEDAPDSEMVLYALQVPLPTSPSRRLKVSMGPRAGCERCRLKVPGHWMHVRE